LVQPVLPVLEYLINYDYIVNELCENRDKPILTCNGKCYLGDQVEKQLDRGPDQQKPIPPKFDTEKFVTLKTSCKNDLFIIEKSIVSRPVSGNFLKEGLYIDSLLRPPIV